MVRFALWAAKQTLTFFAADVGFGSLADLRKSIIRTSANERKPDATQGIFGVPNLDVGSHR